MLCRALTPTLPPPPLQHRLSVRPVLALIPPDFVPVPSAAEVAAVFDAPLQARPRSPLLSGFAACPPPLRPLLTRTRRFALRLQRFLRADGHWATDGTFRGVPYRIHHFRESGHVVWGLTAHILVQVAKAALQRAPEFEELAPRQPPHARSARRFVSAL